jgi:hypothetical protein
MAFLRQEKALWQNKSLKLIYVYVDGNNVSCNYLFRDKMDTSPDFFDKETLVHSLPFITLEFKFNAAVGFARNVLE